MLTPELLRELAYDLEHGTVGEKEAIVRLLKSLGFGSSNADNLAVQLSGAYSRLPCVAPPGVPSPYMPPTPTAFAGSGPDPMRPMPKYAEPQPAAEYAARPWPGPLKIRLDHPSPGNEHPPPYTIEPPVNGLAESYIRDDFIGQRIEERPLTKEEAQRRVLAKRFKAAQVAVEVGRLTIRGGKGTTEILIDDKPLSQVSRIVLDISATTGAVATVTMLP